MLPTVYTLCVMKHGVKTESQFTDLLALSLEVDKTVAEKLPAYILDNNGKCWRKFNMEYLKDHQKTTPPAGVVRV